MAKSREEWVDYIASWRAIEEPEEAIEWLLRGWVNEEEEMWVLSDILTDALRGILPGTIIEIEPYISDKGGRHYLFISAVDAETLTCLTADPKAGTISMTWDLPDGFSSLEEVNEFLEAIVEELVRAYNERVAHKKESAINQSRLLNQNRR